MPPELDLFTFQRGSVTAPAGCGKTHLIAETLAIHAERKPILVLTHTNAGVAALQARLQRSGVPPSAYRLSTLDGFCIRLLRKFPLRGQYDPRILELSAPAQDYPAIRNAAGHLLQSGHLNDVIAATYARLLVDEYQDCNIAQHNLVTWIAQVLPTYVLGDPMQAIFSFAGPIVDWHEDVQIHFPAIGELTTPWRWQRAGATALGNWLLNARLQLQQGQPIDLSLAPPEVQWIQLAQQTSDQQRRNAALVRAPTAHGSVLILGNAQFPLQRFQLASHTPGVTTVETVDLGDLTKFCREFNVTAADSLSIFIEFCARLMTGVIPTALLSRVEVLRRGRFQNPPTPVESAAVTFANTPSLEIALRLLNYLDDQEGTRAYRPDLLRAFRATLQTAAMGTCSLYEAAIQVRERNRQLGRPLARRAIGSTLLLKGLEADVAVILYPEQMTASNLYVALTRGAKLIVICSESPILTPARGR